MKTKIIIEPKFGSISSMIDEFFRIRRMMYDGGFRYFFKYGKYVIEASDKNDTPMSVYDKYKSVRKDELERKLNETD